MSVTLSNTRPFSELKHGDWFMDKYGDIGVKTEDCGKDCAHFFSCYYSLQNMTHNPEVQVLENVSVQYEYVQRVTREIVIKEEVSERTKGKLCINEVPF